MALSNEQLKELIKVGNYSSRFDELRQNRCAVSLYKYGSAKQNFPDKVNALKTMQMCVDKYLETGNTEYLLDAGNYIMFEFMYPSLQNAFFKATESSDSAGISGMSVKEMEDFRNNNYY